LASQDRHRSREFIEFLRLLDAAYPPNTAIKLILDNHSAHISRETRAWLAARPIGRFELTFTPKHGSWLNLIEGFFSKFARSVLRHIRVASKHELPKLEHRIGSDRVEVVITVDKACQALPNDVKEWIERGKRSIGRVSISLLPCSESRP
jgi:transposase